MQLSFILLLLIVGVHGIVQTDCTIRSRVDDGIIEELKRLIAEDQVKNTTNYNFPYSWFKLKGSYSAYISENSEGNLLKQMQRQHGIYDEGVFSFVWITSKLLEATNVMSTAIESDQQLVDAANVAIEYHDKSIVWNTSRIMFWPQIYNNITDEWYSTSTNVNELSKTFNQILSEMIENIGLSWPSDNETAGTDCTVQSCWFTPSDFDDTFAHVGMGTLLKDYQDVNPMPYQIWLSQNQNLSGLFDDLKKYAYRPFSQNRDSNLIDPQTFFVIRDFIYETQAKNQTIALIPTFIISMSENKEVEYMALPFNVNNVDIAVGSNVLYGITATLLSGMIEMELFDDDMQLIYESTASLIAWEISHNFSSRPDLAIYYYPSVYTFFWFTSRILNLLKQFENLPLPIFDRVKSMLLTAMKQNGTEYILKTATQEDQFTTYFDGVMGNGDKDIFGNPVDLGDDRIYTTAMATNALLYTWFTNSTIDPDTPTVVVDTIIRSCEWLNQNTLSGEYRLMGFAYSTGNHGGDDLGYFYPSNVGEFLNGTTLPADYQLSFYDTSVLIAVSGVINETKYEEMLSQKHYGHYTPVDFHGYHSNFKFWTSDALTYASVLLALTQCKAIVL